MAGLSVVSVWLGVTVLPGAARAGYSLGESSPSFPPHHTDKDPLNTDTELNACHYIYTYVYTSTHKK